MEGFYISRNIVQNPGDVCSFKELARSQPIFDYGVDFLCGVRRVSGERKFARNIVQTRDREFPASIRIIFRHETLPGFDVEGEDFLLSVVSVPPVTHTVAAAREHKYDFIAFAGPETSVGILTTVRFFPFIFKERCQSNCMLFSGLLICASRLFRKRFFNRHHKRQPLEEIAQRIQSYFSIGSADAVFATKHGTKGRIFRGVYIQEVFYHFVCFYTERGISIFQAISIYHTPRQVRRGEVIARAKHVSHVIGFVRTCERFDLFFGFYECYFSLRSRFDKPGPVAYGG